MAFWVFFLILNLVLFVINLRGGSALWAGIDACFVVYCLSRIIKVKQE